jgi:hypothetical protein
MANYQIEIQFTGTYQIDTATTVVDPLVIATEAADNFIDAVQVGCLFQQSAYSIFLNIGSFTYVDTWTNQDVIDYINSFMAGVKV